MKRHNFFLPDDIVVAMKDLSLRSGATMSEIVRRALVAFIQAHEKPKADE